MKTEQVSLHKENSVTFDDYIVTYSCEKFVLLKNVFLMSTTSCTLTRWWLLLTGSEEILFDYMSYTLQ